MAGTKNAVCRMYREQLWPKSSAAGLPSKGGVIAQLGERKTEDLKVPGSSVVASSDVT